MPRWIKIVCLLGIFPALLFLWVVVWSWDKSGSWREARELHVETPKGIVSARNVREVSMWRTMAFPGPEAGGVSTEVHGEALALEVAPGKWIFWLSGQGYHKKIVGSVSFDSSDVAGYVEGIHEKIGRPPVVLDPTRIGLVTFLDIDVPDSARFIEDGDLTPFFGPGYRIVSVTVEVTDEPVTEGRLIEVLDWWMEYRGGPYNEMENLKIPNDSPRGWMHLGAHAFWSHEYLKAMRQEWEKHHADR